MTASNRSLLRQPGRFIARGLSRLRNALSWRTSLPLLAGACIIAALPHKLHAESSQDGLSSASQASPSSNDKNNGNPKASIPASSSSSAASEKEPPKPPRVDLTKLKYQDNQAFALADGSGEALLTLDPALQAGVERLLRRAQPVRGAIVVNDLASGKILAIADISQKKPAGGRIAFGYAAPTASLFKLVTAAALLEHAKVSPELSVCTDGGQRRIEQKHLERPKLGKALCAPFKTALGHSRNAAFAQLTTRFLMREQLLDISGRLGFDQDLPFSQKAIVGHVDLPYNDLEFARTAAGFGNTTITPLGALHVVNIIAQGGRDVNLNLVEQWDNFKAPKKVELGEARLRRATARQLRRMMEVTVSSGTSLEAFSKPDGQSYLPRIRVAGKTGTLQPDKSEPTTSWFIGFAPAREPKVALSVMLMNDVIWHYKANEVGRDVLRLYFSKHHGVTSPFAEPESQKQASR